MLDLLLNPYNPNRPAEWGTLPEEWLIRLAPQGAAAMTPAQRAAMNQLAAGEWFLVKNFMRDRCRSCRAGQWLPGAIHTYITLACVPAPFNGLRQIHWLIDQKDPTAKEIFFVQMTIDSIVPITAADAKRLNDKIVERGEQPIHVQRPYRPGEWDEEVIRRRIVRKAAEMARRTAA